MTDLDVGKLPEHDFTVKTWKEDFCIIVEDKRFYVAKNILAFTSSVFERMFQADFKEKSENEMQLPGKLSADVEEFLKCIYPLVKKEVTIGNAFQIIGLVDEYGVVDVKSKCEDCFLRAINEKSAVVEIFKIYNLASLYSLKTVREKCMKLAATKSLAELDKANEKNPIPLMEIQRIIISEMETTHLKTQEKVENLLLEQKKLIALYKYHRAQVPTGTRLELEDLAGWEGASVRKKFKCGETCVFTLYFYKTTIECSFKTSFGLEMLVREHNSLQNSEVKLVGNVVVLNGMAGKKDYQEKLDTKFKRHQESIRILLSKSIDMRNDGYIYNNEICVECNFFALNEFNNQFDSTIVFEDNFS